MPNLRRMAAAKPVEWYAVAQEEKTLTVDIFDVVGGDWFGGGVTADALIRDIEAAGEVDQITVRINSPGGDVMQGIAIYNFLRTRSARIVVEVEGWAASIASIIAMAGDEIRIFEGSFLMLHHPWTMAAGNAREFRAAAAELEKIGGQLVNIYKARSGQTTLAVEMLMTGEPGADGTLLTAADALEKGFATEVIEAKKAAACAGKSFFDFAAAEEDPAEDPEEEKTAEDPEEKPEEEKPAEDPEEKPAEEPEETPAEEPAEDPEETPAEEPEEDPAEDPAKEEEEKAEAPAPAVVGSLAALLPDTGSGSSRPTDWIAAFEACGRDYVKARKKYPDLFNKFLKR